MFGIDFDGDGAPGLRIGGIINGVKSFSNVNIFLTADVQIQGDVTFGDGVHINGNGWDIESHGKIALKGSSSSNSSLKNAGLLYKDGSFVVEILPLKTLKSRRQPEIVKGSFSIRNSVITRPKRYIYLVSKK